MAPQVSIVVPTYKRPDLLNRCLRALMSQDFDPSAYEVIVVDDAADESTQRLVDSWAKNPQAYLFVAERGMLHSELVPHGTAGPQEEEALLPEPYTLLEGVPRLHYLAVEQRKGPAAARNLGWQAACGQIIAFTDDDCLPSPDWLKNGAQAFEPEVAGASGRIIVPLPDQPTDYELDATGLVASTFVTANCFYRRSALEAVGGFDERFTLAWREDSELFFRLLKSGYKLVQAPQAVVVHPVRPAPWGVSLRQQRKSMFNALIYKMHPGLYRQHLQHSPPWQYYAILATLFTCLAGIFFGSVALAWLAGGIWAGLTARFFISRLRRTSRSPRHVLEMLVTSILIPPLCVFWRLRGAFKFRVFFL